MSLVLCARCARHVKSNATSCPFCGEGVARERGLGDAKVVRRMSRAALLGSAGMMLAVADCSTTSPQPAYGACPSDSIDISAPCGVTSITTTCAGATPSCVGNSCTVGPIASDCSVSVVLGDGTSHTVAVTVSKCPFGNTPSAEPGFTDFTSPTCKAADAGTDAAQDASKD